MREVRDRMKTDRKISVFRPVEVNLELKKIPGKSSKTLKGQNLIRARDVDKKVIQDRSKKMVIVGSDVEALYPSLEDTEVAEIVFNAIMDTDVKFDGIDYLEGVRYIALNSTAQECKKSELRRVLPVRRHVNGTRPGVTGDGPMGAERGDQEQWNFPRVELTEREKRLIVATVVKIAVLVLFRTHLYTFGGRFFL